MQHTQGERVWLRGTDLGERRGGRFPFVWPYHVIAYNTCYFITTLKCTVENTWGRPAASSTGQAGGSLVASLVEVKAAVDTAIPPQSPPQSTAAVVITRLRRRHRHHRSARKKNDSQRRRCNPEGLSYGRSPFLGCLTLVCGSRCWATVHFGVLAWGMGG